MIDVSPIGRNLGIGEIYEFLWIINRLAHNPSTGFPQAAPCSGQPMTQVTAAALQNG